MRSNVSRLYCGTNLGITRAARTSSNFCVSNRKLYIQLLLNMRNVMEVMIQPTANTFQERMGDFFERMGQPRIAGRLFGYLLICRPPEQNAAQLKDAV